MKKHQLLKRLSACALVVIMALSSAPLNGFVGLELPNWSQMFATRVSALSENGYTYTVSDGQATITRCATSISGDIVIPDTLGGYPVTSIGGYAFHDCINITSVTIPNNVTNIGDSAFRDCSGLTSIKIPDSVTNIAWYAFCGCANLISITIPDSVTSISWHTFSDCTRLTDVTIPYSITVIPDYAFSGCSSLTEITIPDSVTSIGDYAFSGCTNLTKIALSYSLKAINEYAFFDCNNLDNVIIPDSVNTIGKYAFGSCINLTNLTIGNGVKWIYESAFFKCTSLARVNIYDLAAWCSISFSNSLSNPLYYAHNIYINGKLATNVEIPYKVAKINPFAFNDCACLTSVVIPNSVKSIGGSAFGNCTNLKDVYFCGTEEQWNMIKISSYNESLSDATLHFNHQHDYLSVITEIPTCTKSGMKILTCECGKTYNDIVPPIGHSFTNYISNGDATCTADGTKTAKCDREACDETDTVTDTGSAKGHTPKTTTTKATTSKDGKAVTACEVCGEVSGTVTIYKASSVKLSKTSYTYNGKVQKPTVTVKDSKGKTLKNGTDYTVSYASGCKNTGKYAVKITFKGNYSGTKTLYFNILPSKTSKLTATQTTSSIKATWKAVTGATGYKVTLYNAKGKAIKTVYTTKTTASFSKLSKGTTYKVRVTAYKTIDGKKVSSSVYTQLTTATKPGTPSLKVKAGAKKASLSWNKQTGASGYVVYMATSKNGTYKKIATVKGSAKVSYTKTGLTKGKTYYFKVAAYTSVDGKTISGGYSAVKSAKIK